MKKESLLKILKKDPIRNMSIIGFVKSNPLQAVYNRGDTYIVLAESDHLWAYPASKNHKELINLLDDVEIPTNYYANVEDWMEPIITKDKEVEWKLETRRYYYPKDIEIKGPEHQIENLKEDDIEVILDHSHYAEYLSHDLLKERIRDGISAAVREDGKLVAWGLTHDDKSLGFLHVLQGYRNKGYAQDIGRHLINKKRELNELPYINIEPDNYKSINLSEGMGFRYDRNVSWIKLK